MPILLYVWCFIPGHETPYVLPYVNEQVCIKYNYRAVVSIIMVLVNSFDNKVFFDYRAYHKHTAHKRGSIQHEGGEHTAQ